MIHLTNEGHRALFMWSGGIVVRTLHFRLKRSRVRLSAIPLASNNLGQVVHTPVTKLYNLVLVKDR